MTPLTTLALAKAAAPDAGMTQACALTGLPLCVSTPPTTATRPAPPTTATPVLFGCACHVACTARGRSDVIRSTTTRKSPSAAAAGGRW